MRERKLSCIRRDIPVSGVQITIPGDIGFLVLKNTGQWSVRFNFNQDNPTDYFSLKPGEQSPTINVVGGHKINLKAVTADSQVEAIVWR